MRGRIPVIGWLAAASAIFLVASLVCAAEPSVPPQKNAAPAQANVAPQAQETLQRGCDLLTNANAYTFHAEVMFDQVLRSAVKLQFSGALDYAVQRPNELAINYQSDLGAKQFWYDGKTVTLYDVPNHVYSSIAAPDTINAMMDQVMDAHHLSLPLGDMALSNACGKISKQITFGTWVRRQRCIGCAVRPPGVRLEQRRFPNLAATPRQTAAAQGGNQL